MNIKLIPTTVIHFYRVADLEKQRTFYQTVLGLSVYKDQGQCLIFNVNDQAKIGFCTHHPRTVKDDTCITFVFETLEALKAIQDHLQRHGVSSEPIEHNETFKIRHFFVRDPAQHLLEFQMFIES